MIYSTYVIGGELYHASTFHKYIDKVKTKSGKWRYIYKKGVGNARAQAADDALLEKKNKDKIDLGERVSAKTLAQKQKREEIRNFKDLVKADIRSVKSGKGLSSIQLSTSSSTEKTSKKGSGGSKSKGSSSKTSGSKGRSSSSSKKGSSSKGSSSSASSSSKASQEDKAKAEEERQLRYELTYKIKKLTGSKYKDAELEKMGTKELNDLWEKIEDEDKKDEKALKKRQKKMLKNLSKNIKANKEKREKAKKMMEDYVYRNVNKTLSDASSSVSAFENRRK